ncbi:MAG: tetratricopeptide repeat protein [Terriglobia bacterium]
MRSLAWRVAALTIFLFVPLLRPTAALAQTPTSNIRGVVTGPSGKGLSGVRVTLDLNLPSGEREIKRTTSGSGGSFEFDDLTPSSYTVKASCPSCNLPPDITFQLEAGQNMEVSLVLHEPANAGAASERPAASSTSPSQSAGKKPKEPLTGVDFDQKPAFKAAQYSNPEAGGGYSDSASAGTDRMVREYLAPQQIGKQPGAASSHGRAIEQAAQADPTEGHLNRWGNFLLSQRQYPQAASVFGDAVRRYPRSARLRLGLGIALSSAGKYNEAVEQLVAATDLAPADPEPYLFLGQATTLARTPETEATKRLKHFAEIDPQNAQALYYYAMSLWAEAPGSTNRARLQPIETLLKSASALDPELGQARLELGILYEQEGRDEDALREYQAAARATPGMAAVHYRLSRVYLRSGDQAAAQKELQLYHQAQKQPTAPGRH